MRPVQRILVVQTAFIGDVILTLPLIQTLKEYFAGAEVDVVVVPRAAEVCRNHPAIGAILEYDKRGRDRGWRGFARLVRSIREGRYQMAVLPHRSLRSSALAFLAGIPVRVGFRKGGGRFLLTESVAYHNGKHEVERNLSLLSLFGIGHLEKILPRVYPTDDDRAKVKEIVKSIPPARRKRLVAVAPGTIWNTKRWPKERFAGLIRIAVREGFAVVLVGGKEDSALCAEIAESVGGKSVVNAAGKLTLRESAELIRECRLMVSNDSAPMHLSVAVSTPVVAIFGATVPSFGFAPYGPHDAVVETLGLRCRPCSIHGGPECPIKTFDCMINITPDRVFAQMMDVLKRSRRSS